MPKSEASRPSRVTRITTTTTDFSAVIRQAHRQYRASLPMGKRSPSRNHSTLGTQTINSSFRQSPALVSRIPVAPRPRFVVKGATPQPLPRVKPRFHALTLPVILGRVLLLLWIAVRLATLTLDGAVRAFGKFALQQGRLWLTRRRASESAPMSPDMDSSEALMQT